MKGIDKTTIENGAILDDDQLDGVSGGAGIACSGTTVDPNKRACYAYICSQCGGKTRKHTAECDHPRANLCGSCSYATRGLGSSWLCTFNGR